MLSGFSAVINAARMKYPSKKKNARFCFSPNDLAQIERRCSCRLKCEGHKLFKGVSGMLTVANLAAQQNFR
jgi:hypothetical protein